MSKDGSPVNWSAGVAWASGFVALVCVVVMIVVATALLDNRTSTTLAVCAIADYAETQSSSARANLPNVPLAQRQRTLDAIEGLEELVTDMRTTGIDCPPPPAPSPAS